MGKLKAVITQNVDGLQAGRQQVLGCVVHRNYCTRCGKFFNLEYVMDSPGVPKCDNNGGLSSPTSFVQESLDMDTLDKSIKYISGAEVLIVAGTSLTVYPPQGL